MLSCHTHWDGKCEQIFSVVGVCIMCVQHKATNDTVWFSLVFLPYLDATGPKLVA